MFQISRERDENMAEGSYVAVSDRMKYGVKPSAVRSENYVTDPVFL